MIGGIYFGSHPDIQGYKKLGLSFDEDGVGVWHKKTLLRRFGWEEVVGFDADSGKDASYSSSQRLTVTRMTTLGVFSLAAPKKKNSGHISGKFLYSLITTSGNVELETSIDVSGGGFATGLTSLLIKRAETAAGDVRRFVAAHAKGRIDNLGGGAISVADEIAKFAKLRDEGVIDEDEFKKKKKELLGK